MRDGERWYGAATGFRGRASRSDYDWGYWGRGGDVLNGRPTWAKYAGVWGPEVEQTPNGYVAYFTMPSRGLPHDQDRCIGVATAPDLSSTFTVLGNKPLVCPDYATTTPAFDQLPGRVGLPAPRRHRPLVVRRSRRPPLPALPHAGHALDDPADPAQRRRHRRPSAAAAS